MTYLMSEQSVQQILKTLRSARSYVSADAMVMELTDIPTHRQSRLVDEIDVAVKTLEQRFGAGLQFEPPEHI